MMVSGAMAYACSKNFPNVFGNQPMYVGGWVGDLLPPQLCVCLGE